MIDTHFFTEQQITQRIVFPQELISHCQLSTLSKQWLITLLIVQYGDRILLFPEYATFLYVSKMVPVTRRAIKRIQANNKHRRCKIIIRATFRIPQNSTGQICSN
jgi:hypothetical protein